MQIRALFLLPELSLQEIIKKKSASSSRTLPFVMFVKKSALFGKSGIILRHFHVILRHFWVKLPKKCPFFEDSGRCPEIRNYAMLCTRDGLRFTRAVSYCTCIILCCTHVVSCCVVLSRIVTLVVF